MAMSNAFPHSAFMERNQGTSLIAILVSDVSSAVSRREAEDSQATRRDLVRTLFAAIEGFVWIFREEISDAARETYGLKQEEEFVLSETTYSVTDQGKIAGRPNYISAMASIRLTARIASRINQVEEVDFGAGEWSALRDAFKIRNRITHPKSLDDLTVSSHDVKKALTAFYWLFEKLTDVMASSVTTRLDYLGRFEDVFSKLNAGDPEVTALYNALKPLDT